jgi:hypothetical protein
MKAEDESACGGDARLMIIDNDAGEAGPGF